MENETVCDGETVWVCTFVNLFLHVCEYMNPFLKMCPLFKSSVHPGFLERSFFRCTILFP